MPGAGRDVRAVQQSAAMQDYRCHKSPKLTRRQLRLNTVSAAIPRLLRRQQRLLKGIFRFSNGAAGSKGPLKTALLWLLTKLSAISQEEPPVVYGQQFVVKYPDYGADNFGQGRGPPACLAAGSRSACVVDECDATSWLPNASARPGKRFIISEGRFSRREFFKKSTKVTAGVAGMSLGLDMINPKNAHAYDFSKNYDFSKLPPGIANCRDQMVALMYGDLEGHWKLPTQGIYSIPNRLNRKILHDDNMTQIRIETPYLEPAVYMLIEKMSLKIERSRIWFDLEISKEQNLPLWYFKEGLKKYFAHWVDIYARGEGRRELIEEDFINSIFTSAYETSNIGLEKANEYRNLKSLQDKAQVLNELMQRFSKMKKDEKSTDPNDGYNRCLVAAWSSFMITLNSQKKEGKGLTTMLYYNNLEIPIRKYIPKIRGPPHYSGLG